MRIKKTVLIAGIAMILAASGAVGYIWSQNQKKEQDYAKMEITFHKDRQILEYGEKIDSSSFVKHSVGEVKSYPSVHTKKTGIQTITFVLTYEGQTKNIPYTVDVQDTKKPEIKLKENYVTLEYGQTYDVADNIKSVRDPIDGPLKKAKKTAAGSYWIDSSLNTLEAGSYTITIHAQDRNGNRADQKFTVTVKEKVEQKPKKVNTPSDDEPSSPSQSGGSTAASVEPYYVNGVLLVNKKHALPQNYGGMDSNAYAALQQLQAGAEAAGYSMPLISGYRSYAYQASLYNSYVAQDGQALADTYSARPGHSEHQSGLAFDIGALDNGYGNTPDGRWLHAHCANYGFIIRYPAGKESITGYQYEPWHVRYVGKEIASQIMAQGITLEEYLGDI